MKVLGDFNEWSWDKGVSMKANKTAFTAVVELTTGNDYEFRYLIDNEKWENDWQADAYLVTPFGTENSVVTLEAKPVAKKAATTKKRLKRLLKQRLLPLLRKQPLRKQQLKRLLRKPLPKRQPLRKR